MGRHETSASPTFDVGVIISLLLRVMRLKPNMEYLVFFSC